MSLSSVVHIAISFDHIEFGYTFLVDDIDLTVNEVGFLIVWFKSEDHRKGTPGVVHLVARGNCMGLSEIRIPFEGPMETTILLERTVDEDRIVLPPFEIEVVRSRPVLPLEEIEDNPRSTTFPREFAHIFSVIIEIIKSGFLCHFIPFWYLYPSEPFEPLFTPLSYQKLIRFYDQSKVRISS